MQYNDKIKLAKLIEPSYKQMMIPLYKEFSNYDSTEVRLEVVAWINRHNHSKLSSMFGKRKYRRRTERKLKLELEEIKIKQELENYGGEGDMSYSIDSLKGKKGVKVFTDLLDRKNIKWTEVDFEHKKDYDIKTALATYEVKYQQTDDRYSICLEETGDMDKPGWIYTSKCDKLIIVSPRLVNIIELDFKQLQKWYEEHKSEYKLYNNTPSAGDHGQVWISQFRRIPMSDFVDAVKHRLVKI